MLTDYAIRHLLRGLIESIQVAFDLPVTLVPNPFGHRSLDLAWLNISRKLKLHILC